ncbi:MAG: hypothetical protein RL325_1806, partial [Planctomycetota bacterium]
MTLTTPTTTTTNSLAIRLLKHFAVTSVAAAACCAAGAEADVIRWTNANLVVPASIDGLYIDVQTRHTGSAGAQVPGWDLNPYGPNSLTWFNAAGTGMMRYPGIAEGSAGSLAPGMTIGPAGSFGSGAIVVGAAPGQWQLKGANYFGFRFRTQDGSTHYGWGKFEIGSAIDGSDRRITELAWEATPDAPIVIVSGGPDSDGDGFGDDSDNCPSIANPGQADIDADGAGDACDTDDDGDGVIDPKDNCPVDANADQLDIDGDGAGDACDADADGDGVPNAGDLCQLVRNADQSDLDGDGVGDACDLCPEAAGDAGCGGCPCPRTPETPLACNGGTVVLAAPMYLPAASSAVRITAISSADAGNGGASEFVRVVVEGTALPDISGADCTPQSRSITVSAATFNAWIADGALDATAQTGPDTDCFCANLAYLSLAYSPDCGADLDGDGQGDCVDPDDDNDGVPDSADPFPRDPKEQGDSDGDGVGDNADPDDDNDGLGDLKDNCARAANFDQFDNDGDGEGDACDADDDNDGVLDALDVCPFQPDPLQEDLDADGDGDACDLDDDNDGTLDDSDACPTEYGFCATAGVPGAGCPCPQSDLLPLACNGGVATEVFNLNPGDLQQAAGPILVVVGARADVDAGGTSEFVRVTIDDVAAPDITGPDCEWSNSAFTVPAHVYNSWIADGQLVVTASTGPDTDCTCENVYYFEFQGQFVDCGADTDADGQGDCVDRDDDGDGAPDVDDALPLDPDETVDTDGDGIGDNADNDDDNDWTLDESDACPTEFGFCSTAGVPGTGCPCPQSDLIPLACSGGLTTEVYNLKPGELSQAAGAIFVFVGAKADVDAGGTSEFVRVTIDGVAAPDISGLDCQWTGSAFTVPAQVFNSWIADNQLVVTALTGPDTDCTCENGFYFEFQGQFIDCSADTDADGQGDCVDRDDDGDGVPDVADALPLDPTETADSDGDGIGDNAETDDDNDGVADGSDQCPTQSGAPECLGCPPQACAAPRPDIVVGQPSAPAIAGPGLEVRLSWTAANAGPVATDAAWWERLELRDATGDVVAEWYIDSFGWGGELAAGASVERTIDIALPNLAGSFRLLVVADPFEMLAEGPGESNNASPTVDIELVPSDLVARNAALPSVAALNDWITVSWELANLGPGTASGCFVSRVWLSADDVLSQDDYSVGDRTACAYLPLEPGGPGIAKQIGFSLPDFPPGRYRVFIEVDHQNALLEADESNNALDAGLIRIDPPAFANLVAGFASVPAECLLGGQVEISYTVANNGNRAAEGSFWDRIVFSRDEVLDESDRFEELYNPDGIAEGASAMRTVTVGAPPEFGTYFVFLVTDSSNWILEGLGEMDNTVGPEGPIVVGAPDLALLELTVPESVSVGAPMPVAWRV